MKDIVLRYYQTEAVQAMIDSLQFSRDNIPIVALETGTGKSYTIAALAELLIRTWDARILILGPNKEIVTQDEEALLDFLPKAQVGVYSASLKRKERRQVTLATIGSVHKKATLFQGVNVIIVDECQYIHHRNTGMYRNFFNQLPMARVCGFSATIYRLGHGYIHEGEGVLFNHLALDYTSTEHFNQLVKDGYLAKLIAKPPSIIMDTTDLATRMGDFIEKEMSEKFDKEQLNIRIVDDLIEKGEKYKKWLIFCIDIQHAEHINDLINERGINTEVVHSKMTGDRTQAVQDLKDGKIRGLVNVNTLTTGLDIPDLDLIGMLRPTKSPGLYKQIAGRLLRPWPTKDHGLFLDYAGVVPLLGPINNINIKQKKKGKPGDPIVKVCPGCNAYVAGSARICEHCGFVFEFKLNLTHHSGSSDIVLASKKTWQEVQKIDYHIKENLYNNNPPYLQVTYHCGMRRVTEAICLDHGGTASRKAMNWMRKRWSVQFTDPMPETVNDAQDRSDLLKQPTRIHIDDSGKYTQITGYDFDPIPRGQREFGDQFQYNT